MGAEMFFKLWYNFFMQPPKCISSREDAISVDTLSKTIVFLLYALLLPFIILSLFVFTPLRALPNESREIMAICLFLGIETILFVMILRGYLAWAIPKDVQPFSERQMELGVIVLSLAPWLLRFDHDKFKVFQVILNGSLCIAVLVFFFTKSFLSRRYRFEVLRVLLLPLVQLAFLFRLP